MISNNKQCINNDWTYIVDNKTNKVNLPHCNKELSYNYFDEKEYQILSKYKKKIYIEDTSKRSFLKFDGVMGAFILTINGKDLEEQKGGYIPHILEITEYVKQGENDISVLVDSREREDIPPFGYVVDYLTFGGIYRDVWQYSLDRTYIKNIYFEYEVLDYLNDIGKVICKPIIEIDSLVDDKADIVYTLANKNQKTSLDIKKGISKYNLEPLVLENIALWNVDSPSLHKCNIELKTNLAKDEASLNLGFRKLEIEAEKLAINGKDIKIMGLNRHQSYPYVGYAMPKRAQEEDADILKNELSLNTVRCSHYPQSPYFLDRCDEIGLLVLEEIAGWQHIGDIAWQEQSLKELKAMIERDFNHPSIITWGVRINESCDNTQFYKRTNALARELDKTRLTSGVRYLEGSEFLEDIYTMNDFCHNGKEQILREPKQVTKLDKKVPYIVTEFCGHIYPTKKTDCEERQIEQALRHARVQSKARDNKEILGAIGWCSFDYNTHFDFGSGDRICYHGVMDMFRNPKFASFVYKSQKDEKKEYVLEPLTFWSRGERQEAKMFPIYVFTNCDSIELILGGVSKGIFKREPKNLDDNIKYLKYPPIVITELDGEWGASFTDIEFIGYDKNLKEVARRKFLKNPTYDDILVRIYTDTLDSKYLDATRVCVFAIDKEGNTLPFVNDIIELEVDGDIEIIGKNKLCFLGGSIAFWIRTKASGNMQKAKVDIKSMAGYKKSIYFDLK